IVPAEDAQKDFRKIVNQYKSKVNIPGFRKGKAPLKMVEQLYGDHFKEEFKLKQPEIYYKKALDEADIHPINEAEITKVDWDVDKDFEAVYRFQVMPEIEITKYEGLEVTFKEIEFTDDMVDRALENMQGKFATQEESEVIEDGMLVKTSFKQLDSEKPMTFEREFTLGSNIYSDDMNEKLLGIKIGECVEARMFDPAEDKENDEYKKYRDLDFEISPLSIKKIVLPEINDEFAKDAGFDDLEHLRANIEDDYHNKISKQNEKNKIQALEAAIMEANPIEIPDTVIKYYAEQMAEDAAKQYGIAKEQLIPSFMPIAEMNMKVFYLKNKITEMLDLEINEEDKDEMIQKAADNMKMDVDKYKELYASEISSKEFINTVKEQKTMKLLLEKAVFIEPSEEEENPSVEAEL
ncbi:MAG: trigger factor, partial [Candidatus Stygibacter frigidus]|nr:trigger factor [Candidatus Stygibacter frigidus]